MIWTKDYQFQEPVDDLRADAGRAETLAAELEREVAPGHALHGKDWRVIARAMPNNDIFVECGDEFAVVHFTWTHVQEQPPWPMTTPIKSAEEFESYVESAYDWEP